MAVGGTVSGLRTRQGRRGLRRRRDEAIRGSEGSLRLMAALYAPPLPGKVPAEEYMGIPGCGTFLARLPGRPRG